MVRLYCLAAEQGNARAQFNLGGDYYDGELVKKDYRAAMYWLRLAALQGLKYMSPSHSFLLMGVLILIIWQRLQRLPDEPPRRPLIL